MKVLMVKTNDIVDVKRGYALNHLVPNGLALLATADVVKRFEKEIEERKKKQQIQLKKREALLKELSGKQIVIVEKAAESGELFGSVGIAKIRKALNVAEKVNILVKKPIKEVGSHTVGVELGGSKVNIKVVVKS